MNATRTLRRVAAALVLLASAWFLLPTTVGGSTTYLATHGVSMEPRFSTGDLAVLRPAGEYRVGDVIAYDSPSLHTVVMHRIVQTDGGRFVTRGDANSWLDPDHPAADEVLGRLWFRVPSGGAVLGSLRSPTWIALELAGTAGLLMLGTKRPRRGRHRTRPARPVSLPVQAGARQAAAALGLVTVVAALAEAGLLLAPATQVDTSTVPFTQSGQYAYAATAVPGATYPTGTITTGDPVYTRLASGLTVTLTEQSGARGLTDLTGDLSLALSLSTTDGWRADLGAGPAVPFTAAGEGRTATATVGVDPAAAAQLMARHAVEVGAGGPGAATITVTPVLRATAVVSGRPVTPASLAPFAFSFDGGVLRPAGAPAALSPTATSSVAVEETGPRQLPLPGFPVSLRVARLVVALLLAAASIGWLVATRLGRGTTGGAAGDVLVRFAGRLVPVSSLTTSATVVDVDDADALHRIAQRLDCLVLHHAGAGAHTFAVQDADTTYRYVVPVAEQPVLQPA
ncbi:signal peptidase I [Modestobacter sp. NPDC049651]|uniref:signal peptidase I n=1 Tax=unclassified Modestobacter TaxID=2643866 RepID=UPI0033D52AB8